MIGPLQTSHVTMDTAILFAAWADNQLHEIGLDTPQPLLPILDQAVIQSVIERLVQNGSKLIHVILGDTPIPVRQLLNAGKRWGCKLIYHDTGKGELFTQVMRRLNLDLEHCYAVSNACFLPICDDNVLFAPLAEGLSGRVASGNLNACPVWGGMGAFTGKWLLELDIDSSHEAFERKILDVPEIEKIHSVEVLSSVTPAALLKSNLWMLNEITANEMNALNFGRGSQVHPQVKIIQPVHIGSNVKICEGVTVGPNVVICHDSLISKNATLENCMILPDTYVGVDLKIEDAVVAGNILFNVRLNTRIKLADPGLLSSMRHTHAINAAKIKEQCIALTLYMVLFPLQLLVLLFGKSTMACPNFLSTHNENKVSHFRHIFFPGLREVLRGKICILGPTPDALRSIYPSDFPTDPMMYEQNRYGLLNDSLLLETSCVSPELQFASDVYAYSNYGNVVMTFRLLGTYLLQVVSSLASWRSVSQGKTI